MDGQAPIVAEGPRCTRCEQIFVEGEPATQFLCGHREHTRCFFNWISDNGDAIFRLRCNECQDHVIPLEGDEDEDDRVDRVRGVENDTTLEANIKEKYLTDIKFRTLIKNYVAATRQIGKARGNLDRAIRAKKAAISTDVEILKQQIEGLINPHIRALKFSPEYKQYTSLKAKASGYYSKIRASIRGVDEYTIRRALITQRGLRTWRGLSWRYRRSGASILRSAFYYHFRF